MLREAEEVFQDIDEFMDSLGYNVENTSLDYACSAAGMGNYMRNKSSVTEKRMARMKRMLMKIYFTNLSMLRWI